MEPEFSQHSVNLSDCKDLAEAAEITWTWLYENIDDMPNEQRRQLLDQIIDNVNSHSPNKFPDLETEHDSAIEDGIQRAKAKIEQQLNELDDYIPSQWMTDSMAEADKNMQQG